MAASGLVSIIIPTYKRFDELREAAVSALKQTYPHVEVIVVADGPDPEARAAVAGLDERLRYIELDRNSGPAAARNRGVLESRGEWLCFLDDDDTLLPERLERVMLIADEGKPKQMVSCRTIYRHGGRDDVWPSRPLADGEGRGRLHPGAAVVAGKARCLADPDSARASQRARRGAVHYAQRP